MANSPNLRLIVFASDKGSAKPGKNLALYRVV
jgi:hypothetical protein